MLAMLTYLSITILIHIHAMLTLGYVKIMKIIAYVNLFSSWSRERKCYSI